MPQAWMFCYRIVNKLHSESEGSGSIICAERQPFSVPILCFRMSKVCSLLSERIKRNLEMIGETS